MASNTPLQFTPWSQEYYDLLEREIIKKAGIVSGTEFASGYGLSKHTVFRYAQTIAKKHGIRLIGLYSGMNKKPEDAPRVYNSEKLDRRNVSSRGNSPVFTPVPRPKGSKKHMCKCEIDNEEIYLVIEACNKEDAATYALHDYPGIERVIAVMTMEEYNTVRPKATDGIIKVDAGRAHSHSHREENQ